MSVADIRARLLSAFPELGSELLHEIAAEAGTTASVSEDLVAGFEDGTGRKADALMVELLPVASSYSSAPVSAFQVGAVAQALPRGPDLRGALYLGANLEFRDVPLVYTLHAEQAAVNHAWLSGESGIQRLAVTATPCGHCRQFLLEVGGNPELVVPGFEAARRLRDVLPDPFGPEQLGKRSALMDPAASGSATPAEPSHDTVIAAAQHAAATSYAPYSENPAGCALELADGSVRSGRYAESVAFNPSVLPLVSALSSARMRGGWGSNAPDIRRVILVARRPYAHDTATRSLLRSVGSDVELEVFEL